MANVSRSDKIESIALALHLVEPTDQQDPFSVDVTHTSLIGPHITIKTLRYQGVVTVSMESPVVIYDIKGIKQRFADSAAFLDFFRSSLAPSRPATNSLATALDGATRVGNSVIFERRGTVYLCIEQNEQFEVRYNNQKMHMAADDILMLLA